MVSTTLPNPALSGGPIAEPEARRLAEAAAGELGGTSPEMQKAFVEKAVALARDLDRLSTIRAELRSRLETSPLGNMPRFMTYLEAAYRDVWRRYCATQYGLPQP